MTPSLFLLLVASLILRYLATQAKVAFDKRVQSLLPRSVTQAHLRTLFRQFRDRLPAFRTRALPFFAGQLALNTFSCATLLAGLWFCPPLTLSGGDLAMLRYSGLAVVLAAFLVEAVLFCRMTVAAWAPVPVATIAPDEGE